MKHLLLTFIFFVSLYGSNPSIYSSLGDELYDGVSNLEVLKDFKEYNSLKEKLDKYTLELEEAKKLGFEIESGSKKNLNLEYLSKLRELSKTNEYFKRTVTKNFHEAIQNKDSDLYIKTVNSKLLDTKKYKKKIMNYYKKHSKEIATDGIIQKYLNDEKAYQKRKKSYAKIKDNYEKKAIERIRRNDKLNREALENKLETELQEKKRAIRKAQEKELFY